MALPLPGGPDPDPTRDLKFRMLAEAVLGTGGRGLEIRIGNNVLTFPGSSVSNSLVVSHGLGTTPVFFHAFPEAPSYNITNAVVINRVSTYGTSSVTVQGRTVSGAAVGPGDVAFSWIAIG